MKGGLPVALSALAAGCAVSEQAATVAPDAPSSPSILERSTPGPGSTVAAPRLLVFAFRQPVHLAEVTVTGPDGMASPMMLSPAGAQTRYSLPLDGLQSGVHEVRWRATAAGAVYEGSFRFTARGR